MGILDKYNKSQYNPNGPSLTSNPVALAPSVTVPQTSTFDKTNLDLENPGPLGGPINIAYTTKVGSEVITSPTTQPYTPKNTYSDSFTSPELKARTIDPYK